MRKRHYLILLSLLAHSSLVSPALALDPSALPTGGQIVSGNAAISQSGVQMQVNQTSDRAIINWQGFDIGRDAAVRFNQPSASSVTLNRVLTGDASRIHGQLRANGQIFLINPSGMLFGSSARVDVGGLVASTHDIGDDDFLADRHIFKRNGAMGEIINEGVITAKNGGTVALIASHVTNRGVVTAQGGNLALTAGDKVTFNAGANGHLQIEVDGATISSLVANAGILRVDGGQIVLRSEAANKLVSSVVSNTGTVQARTLENRDGRILLLADMEHGKTMVDGLLDASALQEGNGGFVETSAAQVAISDNARVTTTAVKGNMGNWLIDPDDYTIAASGGDTSGATLAANLAGTNITVETNAAGSGGNGDIFINDAISWSANTTLTFTADRNIEINEDITANGNGAGLVLEYGRAGMGGYSLGEDASVTLSGNAATLQIGQFGGLQNYTLIHDVTELQNVSSNLSGYYALGNDIDASATNSWNGGLGFEPIGNGAAFTGDLHGLGHTVNNLTINRSSTDSVGLFGVAEGAILRDVGLVGGNVTGDRSVGMLVGEMSDFSTLYKAYATGTVTGGIEAGGLIGTVDESTIADSHAAVTVNGSQYAGGLIGDMRDSTLSGSYAEGDVDASDRAAGGLVGRMVGATVSDSYASGSIGGVNDSVGGLVGEAGFSSRVEYSYATGAVDGESRLGGLVGYAQETVVIDESYATGAVSGAGNDVGGLIGYGYNDIFITASYATGDTSTVGDNVGGLAGYMRWADIADVYATGNVSGNTSVGGLIGYGADSTLTRAYSNGTVTANIAAGGLVGNNSSFTVTNSFWDTQTSGQASSHGGTGQTTAQMQTLSTFSGAGWDIAAPGTTSVWHIEDGATTPWLNGVAYIPLIIMAADDSFIYDGMAYSGGNGFSYSFIPDPDTIFGSAVYGGTSQGAENAGSYGISLSGLYSPTYAITFVGGTLTINPRSITITADDKNKMQGDANPLLTFGIGGMGLAAGETEADVFSGALSTAATAASPAGNYAITQGVLAANSNYVITTFTDGTLLVTSAMGATGSTGAESASVPAGSILTPLLGQEIHQYVFDNALHLIIRPDYIRLPAEENAL